MQISYSGRTLVVQEVSGGLQIKLTERRSGNRQKDLLEAVFDVENAAKLLKGLQTVYQLEGWPNTDLDDWQRIPLPQGGDLVITGGFDLTHQFEIHHLGGDSVAFTNDELSQLLSLVKDFVDK